MNFPKIRELQRQRGQNVATIRNKVEACIRSGVAIGPETVIELVKLSEAQQRSEIFILDRFEELQESLQKLIALSKNLKQEMRRQARELRDDGEEWKKE